MPYADNKCADQPAHPRSLISTFVFHCFDSIISVVSISKMSSLWLVSVVQQAGLSLTWSKNAEDRFSRDEAHIVMILFLDRQVLASSVDPDQTAWSVSTLLAILSASFGHITLWAMTRKPVFEVCDQVRLKPVCSATETSYSLEILNLQRRGIILSRQRTTKVLIRLRGCADWSAPLLFVYGKTSSRHGSLYDRTTLLKF